VRSIRWLLPEVPLSRPSLHAACSFDHQPSSSFPASSFDHQLPEIWKCRGLPVVLASAVNGPSSRRSWVSWKWPGMNPHTCRVVLAVLLVTPAAAQAIEGRSTNEVVPPAPIEETLPFANMVNDWCSGRTRLPACVSSTGASLRWSSNTTTLARRCRRGCAVEARLSPPYRASASGSR
jgi:hypothetical protein